MGKVEPVEAHPLCLRSYTELEQARIALRGIAGVLFDEIAVHTVENADVTKNHQAHTITLSITFEDEWDTHVLRHWVHELKILGAIRYEKKLAENTARYFAQTTTQGLTPPKQAVPSGCVPGQEE